MGEPPNPTTGRLDDRYREMEKSAESIILRMDPEGRILFINDFALNFFGFPRERLVGRSAVETIVPRSETSGRDLEAMIRDLCHRPEQYLVNENENVLHDGRRVWLSWVNLPILGEDGKVREVLSVGKDITERRRLEQELRQSHDALELRVRDRTAELTSMVQALQRQILKSAKTKLELQRANAALQMYARSSRAIADAKTEPQLLCDICRIAVDAGYRLAWVGKINEQTGLLEPAQSAGADEGYTEQVRLNNDKPIFGLSPIGRALRERAPVLCNDLLAEESFALFHQAMRQRGLLSAIAFPLIYEDEVLGNLSIYSSSVNAFGPEQVELLRELARNLTFGIVALRTREHRRNAERALRQLGAIVETSDQAIYSATLEGTVTSWNRGAQRLFGYFADEMIGQSITRVIPPDQQVELTRVIESIRQGLCVEQLETLRRHKDGHALEVSINISSLRDDQGEVIGYGAVAQDIGERKRLEREVLEIGEAEQRRIGLDLHDSLGQKLAGTAFLAKVLQQKLESQAHPDAKDAAAIAQHLNDATALTRMLARGLCPVDLQAEGLMNALKDLADQTQKVFDTHCTFHCPQPALIEDNTVAVQLYHIAQEAVRNAVQHGHAQHVTISLTPGGARARLRVEDDGPGLPPDAAKGKGLGLRIMRYRATMIQAALMILPATPHGVIVECGFSNAQKR